MILNQTTKEKIINIISIEFHSIRNEIEVSKKIEELIIKNVFNIDYDLYTPEIIDFIIDIIINKTKIKFNIEDVKTIIIKNIIFLKLQEILNPLENCENINSFKQMLFKIKIENNIHFSIYQDRILEIIRKMNLNFLDLNNEKTLDIIKNIMNK